MTKLKDIVELMIADCKNATINLVIVTGKVSFLDLKKRNDFPIITVEYNSTLTRVGLDPFKYLSDSVLNAEILLWEWKGDTIVFWLKGGNSPKPIIGI